MATSRGAAGNGASEPMPGGTLGAAGRILAHVEDGLNVVAAATIFVVMLGTTISIAARLAGAPLPGYLEASEQAIAVFAFLGAAYAQRLGAHIRMEVVVGRFEGRLRWTIEAAGSFLSLCLVLILIRYSWDFFLNAWLIGDTTYDYGIPTWPSKLLVPLAFSVWALRLALEVAGYVRLTIWPGAAPVGVPLDLSPAEEAGREILDREGIARTDAFTARPHR